MEMTLTGRGQFTFNKGFMEHLGVKPGERVDVRKMPDGKLEIVAANKKETLTVDDLVAKARKRHKDNKIRLTIEELDDCIVQSYANAGMEGLR
ncbi:MAG: AbrB/MazE/SpoVT family DNA-binding domain-containing protein [Azonexus sp.]|jgi:bifunctional DNA-binding transcriptional regulator/antitoxin component of YhaV-PrlF toxin-antitoxin module|nr:AbrB/MazE/SpoVT family DNA-binding domain-containing protein [Azonexus sp.]